MKIVLASASPRRRELLQMLGLEDFLICPAKGEELPPDHATPEETVCSLASAKAREVAAKFSPDTLIIAADTIVVADQKILGKPHSEDEAFRMLRMLSGRTHEVYTGVSLMRDEEMLTRAECTKVRFRELSDREIRNYIATGEPMDKAGAYGAQGKASLFVKGIEGDFFNVVGLPLCLLGSMLKGKGVTIL